MKVSNDTYLLLWGGPVSPRVNDRILYWAFNHEGKLCGVILPTKVWHKLETVLTETQISSPYLSIAVTGLFSEHPELLIINIHPDYLYEFCYLKNTVYQTRKLPAKLELETAKLIGHIGRSDINIPLSALHRTEKQQKGDFFTFLPDKTRTEIFYLVENGNPPANLDVVIMWGLKGFSLPHPNRNSAHQFTESEKLVIERTKIKPQPLWLRRFRSIGKRHRPNF